MLNILQAVLKRLGSLGNEAVMIDEAELLCHQNLQDLYNSTRAAKVKLSCRYEVGFFFANYWFILFHLTNELWHAPSANASSVVSFFQILTIRYVTQHFQRSLVRGVEAFVSISSKQMEIGDKAFSNLLHLVHSTSLVV